MAHLPTGEAHASSGLTLFPYDLSEYQCEYRQMISKTLHRIWFGKASIPAEYEGHWEAWKRQLPHFEFRTWDDASVAHLPLTAAKIAEANCVAGKADIARYEILFRQGGIYLDCDMMPFQYRDFSVEDAAVIVCNESDSDDICSIGFIAAQAGADVFQKCISYINSKSLNIAPPNEETGPRLFRSALKDTSFVQLPQASFYPYGFNEPFSSLIPRDLSATYGIHLWGASWLSDADKVRLAARRFNHGCIAEIENRLDGVSLPEARDIIGLAKLIRDARKAQMTVCRHPLLRAMLRFGARPEFEFLKTGFYLLQHDPGTVIWQIGAADGVIADPLRPLMVNFDPQAVLIEPNPFMYHRLLKNYANNRNMKAVNAAFAGSNGKLVLNAINPEKVRERSLPEWALGISSAFKDRNAIGGHTVTPEIARSIRECIEEIEVKQIDARFVLESTDYPAPDILVVDVEGMDYEVIRSIVQAGILPSIIHFEICCLPANELKQLHGLLAPRYTLLQFGNDVVAYRHDFLGSYCESIFVENGISFSFLKALQFINRFGPRAV